MQGRVEHARLRAEADRAHHVQAWQQVRRRRRERRRGLERRGLLGAQGHRRPVQALPRRHRAVKKGRVHHRQGAARVPHPRHELEGPRRAGGILLAAQGCHGARKEAKDHRPTLHRELREGSDGDEVALGSVLALARHAVPRCHRVHVFQGALEHHQDAPQRRRPPRPHEDAGHRALAAPVQGRGARPRPGARLAARLRDAPPLPGPRLGHPHHRRGDGA
mmetsp:Transcript_92855/g.268127  ORF Transcript_92855/g.268127 Transcript_92855/m.268127 type:complete len:220 (+) Transcript_92855:769-1428(+)